MGCCYSCQSVCLNSTLSDYQLARYRSLLQRSVIVRQEFCYQSVVLYFRNKQRIQFRTSVLRDVKALVSESVGTTASTNREYLEQIRES